jgi:membrane-associated phospholipid phosphatase
MRTVAVILALVFVLPPAEAQSDGNRPSEAWSATVMHDAGTFWHALVFMGTSPARWDSRDVMHAGIVIGSTAMVSLDDEGMSAGFRSLQSPAADRIESIVRQYGEVWVVAALCGSSYVTGLISGDRWLHETAFLAGTGLLLTAGATQVLKFTAGRARPYMLEGPGHFRMLSGDDDHHSFPSGHTAAAFSLSTVLAHQIGNVWASAGLYTLAALTSLSRVYAGEHWFSDCVFSAMLSTAMTQSLLQWYDARSSANQQSGFRIAPTLTGISLVYTFN